MRAEPAHQQRLLNLADLDQEVARVQHAARALPQHKRIAELMSVRQEITDDLIVATTELDDLQVAVRRAEADLVPVRARLERESVRVNDGSISDGKTLRGLTEEVERLKRRISDLEDAELDVMGRVEDAEGRVQRLAGRKADVEAELREQVAERDAAVAKLTAEAKDLIAARQGVAKDLPADLTKLYERIREHSGVGAAKLHRGRCTGCQLEATVSDLDSYRKAPADQVLRCVECERILVRTEDSGL